ncbi:uncharacterized protein BDV14DRAFT_171571 [Aspergillus stella-maris]|uniref:uncharacterized protein n=1 Tax=Aspergillus stella-maris TaxID=1810926 RepID=UPI003CCE4465
MQMRAPTMAITMSANKQAPHFDSNADQTLCQDAAAASTSSFPESCIIARLSKWLWSCRTNAPIQYTTALTPTDENTENGIERNEFPCRACQVQGVQCDRLKPRCAHCLDQQVLCFYVEPLRVQMKRSKEQARALRLTQEGSVASRMAGRVTF